jgi:hypothetical protein
MTRERCSSPISEAARNDWMGEPIDPVIDRSLVRLRDSGRHDALLVNSPKVG